MNIVFVDTCIWEDIKEACYNKLISEINIGIYNNIERAKAHQCKAYIISNRLDEYPYSILKPIYKDRLFDIQNHTSSTIYWNSSFVYNHTICEQLTSKSSVFSENGIWIAIKIEKITKTILQQLHEENLSPLDTSKNITLTEFRSYETIITGIQHTISDDIDLYIKTHLELEEIYPNVFVHPKANLRNPIDFDTTNGKIIIESNTKITAFTLLEAPVFIGKDCLITRAFIRPKTVIHNNCRVAGEVSLTNINSYSNKSHDGCIAVSYIGSWVNLGAGTECATLKYTYTPLTIKTEDSSIKTKLLSCGTIFNDYVVTGVGTILSPATVLGIGTSLHIPYKTSPNYSTPFSWGEEIWDFNKWIHTVIHKSNQKEYSIPREYIEFYQELYNFLKQK